MGAIYLDPRNPEHAIGADMRLGAVESENGGGRSWHRMGSPSQAMAVAVDPTRPREIAVIGTGGASLSTDGGRSWSPLTVPVNTAAATYNAYGDLIVATLTEQRAQTYVMVAGKWNALT